MPRRRHVVSCFVALVALVLLAPVAALADSAGDQQYVDPLGGSTTPGTHKSSHPSSPSPSPTPSSQSSSAPTSPATSSASTATATTVAASSSTPAASSDPSGQSSTATLPFTGLDLWPSVAIGIGLLGSGVALRLVLRRR
jgi:hypothetical protein